MRPSVLGATALTMLAFAANSLLTRAAISAPDASGAALDPWSFTAIRLAAGAVALAALVLGQGGWPALRRRPGTWVSAACLFAYALAFSLAYLRLGAATGALVLFSAVQAGMIAWSLAHGDRPGPVALIGLIVALLAFVALLWPGLHTPDPAGTLAMAVAGFAWAAYTVRGRTSRAPLADTAGNFVRAALLGLPLVLVAADPARARSGQGLALAVVAGAVTSGLGYALWYRTLPALRPIQAASVQLTVPVLAAIGAGTLLAEPPSLRLVVAGTFILGGVALTIFGRA